MNKLMISPSLAFISNETWQQDGFKEAYFETMIHAFKEIDRKKDLGLIWSDNLESILWTEPQYKPWSDLKERNSIVPIFYKFFQRNVQFVAHNNVRAEISPDFEHEDERVLNEYKCISNQLVLDDVKFAIFKREVPCKITTHCKKCYAPLCCDSCFDIVKIKLNEFILVDDFEERSNRINHVIDAYLNHKNLVAMHQFTMTSSFLRRIASLNSDDLLELIDRLSLRISYSGQQARECKVLQDEFITSGGVNEFRMRITNRPTSKRVHYIIKKDILEFRNYYGVGEHDDGL